MGLIVVRPRQEEAHIHFSLHRFHEQIDLIVRGRAIGIGDPDSFLRGREGNSLDERDRRDGEGMRGDYLRPEIARGRERRELAGTSERLAVGLDPVRLKGRLHRGDDRTFETHVRVSPVLRVLGVSGPEIAKGRSSGERHLSIHHQDAPVRPPIRAIHPPRKSRMVVGEFATRFLHHPHIGIVEIPTRTDAVEQDAHFEAGPRAFAKRVPKLVAQRSPT